MLVPSATMLTHIWTLDLRDGCIAAEVINTQSYLADVSPAPLASYHNQVSCGYHVDCYPISCLKGKLKIEELKSTGY